VPVMGVDDVDQLAEPTRHVVEMVDLEQWVDEELWWKASPCFEASTADVDFPSLAFKQATQIPLILRDMEHQIFNKTVDRGDDTEVELFEQNETSALRGSRGAHLRMVPIDAESSKKVNLEATVFLSQSERSPLDPLGEFAPTLMVSSDSDLKLSCWLKDARGQIFASPVERYDSGFKGKHKSSELNSSNKGDFVKRVEFEALRGDLSSYTFVGDGRRVAPRYPLKLYALQVIAPKENYEVNVFLDDLGCWDGISKPKLWRKSLYSAPAFVESIFGRSPYPVFASKSGWGIFGSSAMDLPLDSDSADEKNFMSSQVKAKSIYDWAKDKWETLLRLDRNSQKTLSHFFRPQHRSPQASLVPQLTSTSTKGDGLELSLSWAEQKALEPWLSWGCATVLLKSIESFAENHDWIPIEESRVGGIKFSHWSSGHLDTTLRFVLMDDCDRYFVRSLDLDKKGLFTQSIAFDYSGFEILTEGGRRHQNQEPPQLLRLVRVEIRHEPKDPKHAGVQHLKLYPLEWLLEG
jgi:hypothetical protein